MQSIQRVVTATFVSASLLMAGLLVLQPGPEKEPVLREARTAEDAAPQQKEGAVTPAVDLTTRPPPSPRSAIL